MYKLPKLYSSGVTWYVYYSFLDPETNRFVRIIVKSGLNSAGVSNADRRDRAKVIILMLTKNLELGFSPFKAFSDTVEKSRLISRLVQEFIDHKESTTRDNTFKKYKQQLNLFAKSLDPLLKIQDVRKSHILEFLLAGKSPKGVPWSGKTYNHYLLNITIFFKYYLTQYDDYLVRNPAMGLDSRTTEEIGNIPITDKDMVKVKEYLTGHYPIVWTFCLTIYYAGLRPHTEARLMKVGYFDFERAIITIPGNLSKNRKTQMIPFDRLLMAALEFIKAMPSDHFVFGGKIPLSDDWFMHRFKKTKESVGLPPLVTMYSFKHLRAIHLYTDTRDINLIKELFRHSSVLTTQIYLRDLGLLSDSTKLDSREL